VRIDGATHTITAVTGTSVRLAAESGQTSVVLLGANNLVAVRRSLEGANAAQMIDALGHLPHSWLVPDCHTLGGH
jgi:hypothetical protein